MAGRPAVETERREEILRAAFEVAAREGIGGTTVRAVAAAADVSHALVLFHFGRKERLIEELLDWLLASMSGPELSDEAARLLRGLDRFHALLEQEMRRLSGEPRRTRLFYEFWAMGTRHAVIGQRIRAEMERYRRGFRDVIDEVLSAEPGTFANASADGLAAVAVSWVHGCAVQAMVDPENFDFDEYLGAVEGITGARD